MHVSSRGCSFSFLSTFTTFSRREITSSQKEWKVLFPRESPREVQSASSGQGKMAVGHTSNAPGLVDTASICTGSIRCFTVQRWVVNPKALQGTMIRPLCTLSRRSRQLIGKLVFLSVSAGFKIDDWLAF